MKFISVKFLTNKRTPSEESSKQVTMVDGGDYCLQNESIKNVYP